MLKDIYSLYTGWPISLYTVDIISDSKQYGGIKLTFYVSNSVLVKYLLSDEAMT